METKLKSIRTVTLTAEDVLKAIKEYIEKNHEPKIVFPDTYELSQELDEIVATLEFSEDGYY